MNLTILIIILIVSAAFLFYGFFKANFPLFLLGAVLIFLTGFIVMGEGVQDGNEYTVNDGVSLTTITPTTLTPENNLTINMLSKFLFFGGIFLLSTSIMITIMNFVKRLS